MAFGDFLFGKKGGFQTAPSPYSSEQQNALNMVLMQALQGLQQSPYSFEPIKQQALSTFQQDIIPSLAERFAGLGATNSSGFTGELARAGTGLSRDLASLQSQYNLQQQGSLQNLLGLGLQPQNQQYYRLPQQGFLGQAAQLAPLLLSIFGPAGTAAGAGISGLSALGGLR